jgi:peptidyl-prolyl cis-trans isomerase B (cyclophilin B)
MMANDNRAKREQLRVFEARQVLQGTKKKRTRGDQWKWTASAIGAVVVASLALAAYSTIGPGTPAQVPDASLSENREWSGQLTISGVVMDITLDGVRAPQATANFVSLAQEGFFDQTACHRLTTEGIFVLQCGDPAGNGTGGPGYAIPDENLPEEGESNYPAGTVAMANAGPGTGGSQFFIVYADTTLPSGYTIWGTVAKGLDVVQGIAAAGVEGGGADGPPAQRVVIEKATLTTSPAN